MQQVLEDVLQYPVLRQLSALPRIGAIGAPAHLPTPKPPRVYPVPLPSISVNACLIICSKKDDEPKGPTKLTASGSDMLVGVRKISHASGSVTEVVVSDSHETGENKKRTQNQSRHRTPA